MTLIFEPNTTIVFFGDSITDCDRLTPAYAPLGWGYVYNIHCLLQSVYPQLDLTIINKGVSGDRVTDLQTRLKTDVLDINPDYLFIYIGINDVWRFIAGLPQEGIPLDVFVNSYQALITETLVKTKSKILLVVPFLAECNPEDSFLQLLAQYQTAIIDLGASFKLPVIPLQHTFDLALQSKPTSYWTSDRVHPTEAGHMRIALTILQTCKFTLPT